METWFISLSENIFLNILYILFQYQNVFDWSILASGEKSNSGNAFDVLFSSDSGS